MDKWKIVLVWGKLMTYRHTMDVGYIYMDWENPPFMGKMLRMVGGYTLYLVVEEE